MAAYDSTNPTFENTSIHLVDYKGWPSWYMALRIEASRARVWELIDPMAPDARDVEDPVLVLTQQRYLDLLDQQRTQAYIQAVTAWDEQQAPGSTTPQTSSETIAPAATGQKPEPPPPATLSDIDDVQYKRMTRDSEILERERVLLSVKLGRVWKWIHTTVDSRTLEILKLQLGMEGTPQKLIRILKSHFEPAPGVTENLVRTEYREALKRARIGSVDPHAWYMEWSEAYTRAKAYGVPEVEGRVAVEDFLHAVGTRLAKEWARNELTMSTQQLLLGQTTLTLDDYQRVLPGLIATSARKESGGVGKIFATLGSRPSGSSSGNGPKADCPCGRRHFWKPENCSNLELALTGRCDRDLGDRRPTKETLQQIKSRAYGDAKWAELRTILRSNGWMKSTNNSNAKSGGTTSSNDSSFPGSFSAALINPDLFPDSTGIYTTFSSSAHPLLNRTITSLTS